MTATYQEALKAFQPKGVSADPIALEYTGKVHGLIEALARYDRQLDKNSLTIG